MLRRPSISTLFPYTTLFRSIGLDVGRNWPTSTRECSVLRYNPQSPRANRHSTRDRSEEHTSELQSHSDLVCRLLLEKKKYPHTKLKAFFIAAEAAAQAWSIG